MYEKNIVEASRMEVDPSCFEVDWKSFLTIFFNIIWKGSSQQPIGVMLYNKTQYE